MQTVTAPVPTVVKRMEQQMGAHHSPSVVHLERPRKILARLLFDLLKGEVASLKARMGSADRATLDSQLEGIRGIEKQLTLLSTPSGKCVPYVLPAGVTSKTAHPDLVKVQLDMMTMAHICGMTQISTFMFSGSNSYLKYNFIDPTIQDDHHALSHKNGRDPVIRDWLIKIYAWQSAQVAYMMDRLAAAPDPAGGGSLLDNTTILWGNELGNGKGLGGNTHSHYNIPWIIAGGTGGYFKMGRFLQIKDQPHNNMLLSVLHAMGLENEKSFGMPALCTGPMNELRVKASFSSLFSLSIKHQVWHPHPAGAFFRFLSCRQSIGSTCTGR